MAQSLKTVLEKKYEVYLTRSDDRHITLDERAKMADTVKADLFISLHFNSSTDPSARGLETYYLDNHEDNAVKKVEKAENLNLDQKGSVIDHILIDLSIKLTTAASTQLADAIHSEIVNKKFPTKDRGYKAGLLYVLALSKRPGVLIEAGFISNAEDLKMILAPGYFDQYAQAIEKGIVHYFALKKKNGHIPVTPGEKKKLLLFNKNSVQQGKLRPPIPKLKVGKN
jgi:N-acetylmuramoyl-L-alanine amidase